MSNFGDHSHRICQEWGSNLTQWWKASALAKDPDMNIDQCWKFIHKKAINDNGVFYHFQNKPWQRHGCRMITNHELILQAYTVLP